MTAMASYSTGIDAVAIDLSVHDMKSKLLVIVGPTASGKTEIAIELAKKFNGEIVCADSRTIYRGMDIGTAKPGRRAQNSKHGIQDQASRTKDLVRRERYGACTIDSIVHYVLDIRDPDEAFSVADFQRLAYEIIPDIQRRNKLPVLAGGTGLYVSAVVDGLNFSELNDDPHIRRELEKRELADLVQELGEADPAALTFVDTKNKRRVVRALEVYRVTGKPFSTFRTHSPPDWDILQIGITRPRQELYERINQRVDLMIEQGLISEVRDLAEAYGWDAPALSALGYKQMGMFIRGELAQEEAIELLKRDTRRYAKRQLTWLRRDERIYWTTAEKVFEYVTAWLAHGGCI
jgi:tRNA dimethylallyltransferase